MPAQPVGEHACALRLAPHPHLERREPAEQQPGDVRRRHGPGSRAELPQALGVLGAAADDGADERVVVAGEVLRRGVEREVAAAVEGPHVERGGRRRVAHDRCGMRRRGLEVGQREEGVRRRLEPHERRLPGRRSGLVELDVPHAPAAELVEEHAGPVVGALGEGDGVPGLEQRQHDRRRGRGAGREEEGLASVEPAERPLCLGDRRAGEARVGERPRLAALVGPGRRAVERRAHRRSPTRLAPDRGERGADPRSRAEDRERRRSRR